MSRQLTSFGVYYQQDDCTPKFSPQRPENETSYATAALGCMPYGQTLSTTKSVSAPLRMELRTSSQVRMTDDMLVSVYFRSPDKTVTIWNALWWSGSTGLELWVFDSSGHRLQHAVVPSGPLPPDPGGKNALISIGGMTFAGFDSHFTASELFPHAGSYTIKCIYNAPLSRNYFEGRIIWGKEDGVIESVPVSIVVEN
jgi:hypothetical protein